MLSIRMQRTGRKGHAMFRVVVQESRLTPSSGKVVAMLGSYDPHTKVAVIHKDKASLYLNNGAQPSDRAASLLQKEGIDMPKWVTLTADRKRTTRSPEKLRKNQSAKPKEETATEEKTVEETVTEKPATEETATDEVAQESEPASAAEETEVEAETPAPSDTESKTDAKTEPKAETEAETASTEA